VVAHTQIIKGIRGWLNSNKKGIATATGAKVKRASEEDCWLRDPGNLSKLTEGYTTETHKLQYGMSHALFVTRSPGFLTSISEEALWQELTSTRFTTPLLRSWMPWLTERLVDHELLVEAYGFQCRCGVLQTTTDDLDDLVSEGLREGPLVIPSQWVA
jgi:hypothetical protein